MGLKSKATLYREELKKKESQKAIEISEKKNISEPLDFKVIEEQKKSNLEIEIQSILIKLLKNMMIKSFKSEFVFNFLENSLRLITKNNSIYLFIKDFDENEIFFNKEIGKISINIETFNEYSIIDGIDIDKLSKFKNFVVAKYIINNETYGFYLITEYKESEKEMINLFLNYTYGVFLKYYYQFIENDSVVINKYFVINYIKSRIKLLESDLKVYFCLIKYNNVKDMDSFIRAIEIISKEMEVIKILENVFLCSFYSVDNNNTLFEFLERYKIYEKDFNYDLKVINYPEEKSIVKLYNSLIQGI